MTEPKKRGRPPGTGLAAKLRTEMLSGGKLTALVEQVYRAAMAGDMTAAKLILERVIPALRAQAAPVTLEMPTGITISEQAQLIIAAAAQGSIPIDAAAELVRALGALVSIEEHGEVKRRLDALEAGGEFA